MQPAASASGNSDLTRPGRAQAAVAKLAQQAGTLPIIKVDLSATTASLSAVKDGKVVAWQWEDGVVTPTDSDIEYVEQASFTPADFALGDLGSLFRTAAQISGSSSNQGLQIVDYNAGQVLMTVTTRPESMPVFFRRDGTAITEAGVVVRPTRQAKVPAWTSSRKASATGLRFPASIVDAAVLAKLAVQLPQRYQADEQDVSFTIHRVDRMVSPVIEWTVGGRRVITTLSGTDISDQLP